MTTINVETLAKENVRLYEENLKLRLMLGKGTSENKKVIKSETNTSKLNKTTNRKNNKNNKKQEAKSNAEKQTVKKDAKEVKTELSKFQQEREAKKSVVLAKRLEKVPVPEIAKAINQSEPTVRNYIRELRSEGRLVK